MRNRVKPFEMYKLLILILFLGAYCNDKADRKLTEHNNFNRAQSAKQNYYVRTLRELDDTLGNREWPKPDSTFHISATRKIDTRFGVLEIIKYTNEPCAPTDGGIELFYERTIGMIYSRSLTWPEYTRIHFYNDSLNDKVALLIDRILANPELCNFPVFDTSKMKIEMKRFTPPKIVE